MTTPAVLRKTKHRAGAGSDDEKMLSDTPYCVGQDTLVGYVVKGVTEKYFSNSPLADQTLARRMRLVAHIMGELLKGPSPSGTRSLPFYPLKGELNPVLLGIVDAHFSNIETGTLRQRVRKATLTFSGAQIAMACCFYGASAIPMHPEESAQVFSTSVFALYLSALVETDKKELSAYDFIRALDHKWRGGDTATLAALETAIDRKKEEGTLEKVQYFCTHKILIGNERPLPTTDYPLIRKILNAMRKKSYITPVMSPFPSSYADSFILCGKALFFLRDYTWKNLTAERAHLLQMGLVPEGTTREELSKYAEHILLTSFMCQELAVACALPVLCVEERKKGHSALHEMKVRIPNADDVEAAHQSSLKGSASHNGKKKVVFSDDEMYVHPIISVELSGELRAEFTRTETETDCTEWECCSKRK